MANQKAKKKLDPRKPKFSAYWIYAAIIIIFLGLNLFGNGGFSEPAKTNPAEFKEYLKNGDVERVEIINRNQAHVFLTQEAKEKEIHKKNIDPDLFSSGDSPVYSFQFGDLQNFEDDIDEIKNENNLAPVDILLKITFSAARPPRAAHISSSICSGRTIKRSSGKYHAAPRDCPRGTIVTLTSGAACSNIQLTVA